MEAVRGGRVGEVKEEVNPGGGEGEDEEEGEGAVGGKVYGEDDEEVEGEGRVFGVTTDEVRCFCSDNVYGRSVLLLLLG